MLKSIISCLFWKVVSKCQVCHPPPHVPGCPDSPVNGRPKPRKMKYKESLVAGIPPGWFCGPMWPPWDGIESELPTGHDGTQIDTMEVMILNKSTPKDI